MRKRIYSSLVIVLAVILITQPTLALARAVLADSTDSRKPAAAAPRNNPAPSASSPGPGRLPALKRINGQIAKVTGESTTLLPDGRLLRIGGMGADGPQTGAIFTDARTGEAFQAVGTISRPRSWHTTTLLPNGNVLLVGGLDPAGQPVDPPEIFNVETLAFEMVSDSGLAQPAHHSATLLTESPGLVAGGRDGAGNPLDTAELWDYRTRVAERLEARLKTPRYDHAAALLAAGQVVLWQGAGRRGTKIQTGELFDPQTRSFAFVEAYPEADDGPVRLAGSLPRDGAKGVAVEAVVALRFSARVKMDTV